MKKITICVCLVIIYSDLAFQEYLRPVYILYNLSSHCRPKSIYRVKKKKKDHSTELNWCALMTEISIKLWWICEYSLGYFSMLHTVAEQYFFRALSEVCFFKTRLSPKSHSDVLYHFKTAWKIRTAAQQWIWECTKQTVQGVQNNIKE